VNSVCGWSSQLTDRAYVAHRSPTLETPLTWAIEESQRPNAVSELTRWLVSSRRQFGLYHEARFEDGFVPAKKEIRYE
jgi:hypothetical protein